MFNKKENKETVLNKLFENREENLCMITESDKAIINELVSKNNTYQTLLEKIEGLSEDKNLTDKVKESLESYMDRVNIIGSYENEKFYKTGFIDAINLILECI